MPLLRGLVIRARSKAARWASTALRLSPPTVFVRWLRASAITDMISSGVCLFIASIPVASDPDRSRGAPLAQHDESPSGVDVGSGGPGEIAERRGTILEEARRLQAL